nr:hypothetical protein [Luteimonas sp. XNQY3]
MRDRGMDSCRRAVAHTRRLKQDNPALMGVAQACRAFCIAAAGHMARNREQDRETCRLRTPVRIVPY